MKKVHNSAIFIADYLVWIKIDCHEDNTIKGIEKIHEDIYSLVKKLEI